MATLAAALAEQVNVLAELRIRLTVAEASVPSARQRAAWRSVVEIASTAASEA